MAAFTAPGSLRAQETNPPQPAPGAAPAAPASEPFSFDLLTQRMRDAMLTEPQPPAQLPDFLGNLDYDAFQRIVFRDDHARWADADHSRFRLHAFHPGWLFKEPVALHEVVDGQALPFTFSTEDFEYRGFGDAAPAPGELPGVAGFRLLSPLNRADKFDELVSFLGASYFRALGRGNIYGLSARGLAVNTGLSGSEEFPMFTEFWVEHPVPGSASFTLYAALRSASVTGAYRFVIRPGETTEMDVTARLFLRRDIEQLGIAPLTSMFLFGGADHGPFDDFRPAVHDSEALVVTTDGETLFRPLNNPPRLGSSYLAAGSPKSFGLVQRSRDFDQYLDAQAHYEKRPSVTVEPLGDWGPGTIRLLEIPSQLEVNDNIVAYWTPKAPTRAGDALEFSYRLHWGMTPPGDGSQQRARILRTRVGKGGVSGVESDTDSRKFVIDFAGGLLSELPDDAEVLPKVAIAKGTITETVLSRIPGTDEWRLVIEAEAPKGAAVELNARIEGYGQTLTETWLDQWVRE